jgi:hypothetical protein
LRKDLSYYTNKRTKISALPFYTWHKKARKELSEEEIHFLVVGYEVFIVKRLFVWCNYNIYMYVINAYRTVDLVRQNKILSFCMDN